MATPQKSKQATKATTATKATRSKTVKCSCANCQCTVDPARAVRKGNLVFCNAVCAERCTREACVCEHDHCSV
jgi:hypothetical protein